MDYFGLAVDYLKVSGLTFMWQGQVHHITQAVKSQRCSLAALAVNRGAGVWNKLAAAELKLYHLVRDNNKVSSGWHIRSSCSQHHDTSITVPTMRHMPPG